jgi:hypothetical protein
MSKYDCNTTETSKINKIINYVVEQLKTGIQFEDIGW